MTEEEYRGLDKEHFRKAVAAQTGVLPSSIVYHTFKGLSEAELF